MVDAVKVAPIRKPGANGNKPGINAVQRTWTSQGGFTFTLKRISSGMVQRMLSDNRGKPMIPQTVVSYGEGHIGTEANPNDPAYIEQKTEWLQSNQMRATVYCLGNGVELEVPAEFQDQYRSEYPDATENELRYYYLTSLISADEIASLVEAINSQNTPTEEAISQAMGAFPDNGER